MWDKKYTADDHALREEDAYANTKYDITIDWLRSYGVPTGAHIANVGAGGGVFGQRLLEAGFNAINVEPDPVAARMARDLLGQDSVVESDIFSFSPEVSLDVVIMHDVIEHIEDDRAAVSAVWRLLGEGSRPALFIASVPAWQWLFGFHDRALGHYRRYSPRTFRALLASHFQVLRLRQFGILGVPAAWYFSRFRGIEYPVGRGGSAERLFGLSCAMERRICLPVGSSILVAGKPLRV